MIKAILSQLSSSHQRLRTKDVEGSADRLPAVGETFVLLSKPIEMGSTHRVIATTPVTEIRHHTENGSLEFWTKNSHYGLQILDLDVVGNA